MADYSDKWKHDGLVMTSGLLFKELTQVQTHFLVIKASMSHQAFSLKNLSNRTAM
ncbi:hypothetical protein O9993_05345 [Vibrio lentus]|nr:hypothetical protein [Vibrio lentus]